ncbi:MAG: DNA double-strand break repair nuclease NurA [Tissierellales bacterium]|nr:DNA double-strand break repair nuclease NurA [Tissierellales bacterium]
MLDINEELKTKIIGLNEVITRKYSSILDKNFDLRKFLEENIGSILKLEKLTLNELNEIKRKGGIVAVDGSTNRKGGSFPHYIELFQGLAKSTDREVKDVFLTDIYTPLLSQEKNNPLEIIAEEEIDEKNRRLAQIEIKVALESAKRKKPFAIIMDGGLIRYKIYAKDLWKELVDYCILNNVILFGTIKDIKTQIIGEEIKNKNKDVKGLIYDREMLFGTLQYKEMLLIYDELNKKEQSGFSSGFIRSSLSPNVVGIDIIEEQSDLLIDMARLIITLTPENSRGVPLFLDIVDKEVKISDDLIEALLEKYLDRGIYERLFISERDKRNL